MKSRYSDIETLALMLKGNILLDIDAKSREDSIKLIDHIIRIAKQENAAIQCE